ncbi:MAG TPA: DUF2848 family protein [bacterium]|nr:DUF2848 family protein [bacterium]
MHLELEVAASQGVWRWTPRVRAVLNAGWAGRDRAAVAAHIEEMRALGVPAPEQVPIVFPVARAMLTQGDRIEIYSPQSSGEVEYVLIASRERVALTVGSDHTDRRVEATSIELSKQICPNVLARTAWDYADLAPRVDDLILRAWVRTGGTWERYQEAPIGALLAPAYWLGRLTGRLTEGAAVVLFSGTVPTLGGAVRYGDGFRISLEDPRLGRSIVHEYDVALVENPLA